MIHETRPTASFIDGPHGRIAYLQHNPASGKGRPGLVWLGGYASDMRGTKAQAIGGWAAEWGVPYLRFDYSGHGESDGEFEDGTISRWAKDSAFVLEHLTKGPQILIGSSMGGWMAGLLAQQMPERIAAMMLIAPAPDFATELTPDQWPDHQWKQLQDEGRVEIPSEYDDFVMVYTKAMFEDGSRTRVLDKPLKAPFPVRILTGQDDDVVPWRHAMRYANHLDGEDISLTIVKGGDHRMSGPKELSLLKQHLEGLLS